MKKTLAALINEVKAADGVTLETIARRADLPLSTVGAYATGRRGADRPPPEAMLDKLAVGLQRPAREVYIAAGRIHPSQVTADDDGLVYVGDLDERDLATIRVLLASMRRRAAAGE